MKICVTSDLHGILPDVPECDLLLIAGDVCPDYDEDTNAHQLNWLEGKFLDWCKDTPAKNIVATWGNHDFVGEVPGLTEHLGGHYCTFLSDSVTDILGLTIYGSPWSNDCGDWAFADKTGEIKRSLESSPAHDILMSHCPPWRCLDRFGLESFGSKDLRTWIEDRQPKMVLCGHAHSQDETFDQLGNTVICNNAFLGNSMFPHKAPMALDQSLMKHLGFSS